MRESREHAKLGICALPGTRKATCLPENKGGHQRQQENSVVVITLSQMSNPHRELRGREHAGTGARHAAHTSRALFKTRHTQCRKARADARQGPEQNIESNKC